MIQDKANLKNNSSDKIKFETSPTTVYECKNWIAMFAITFSLSISIVLAITVITGHLTTATDEPYNENLVDNLTPHEFIDRQKWGGKPFRNATPLQHPVGLVIIAHTVTPFCSTFAKCSKAVTAMQKYHISLGLTDIAYNFLIGGDGHIYVGRGWDAANAQRNQSVSVSFIGNFLEDYLTEEMIEALHILLSEGVELMKLKEDYAIMCHNQTSATLSPGDHVYNVIKKWSHFKSGRLM